MTGPYWIYSWIVYLLVALGGGGLLTRAHHTPARRWLSAFMFLGALGLIAMAAFLTSHYGGSIALPAPFPTLIAAPLPLASLWSAIAGLLFFSAALIVRHHPQQHRILYALIPLVAAVGVYLWSGDGLLLLLSWEFISASTYLGLVTTRRARPVWNAGWALLALSELGGMLLLLALVWLIPVHTASLHDAFSMLNSQAHHLAPSATTLIMIFTILAFGVKAGLFPVMIWMPMAEPEAPGVVAGIFSGLLTALAISGILAIAGVAGSGITWGIVLLILGVLGALSGALYSIISRHVKRILAYSTLEILGLVFAGLGIWRIDSLADPRNIVSSLALDGAILLLVMHAGAKFALFALTDYTGQWSHTLDSLGGLIHRGPWTAFLGLVGIMTLGAFPPLGGFVAEWLLLESILKPLRILPHVSTVHMGVMIAGSLIAVASALGVLAYLRWYAFIFLGTPRGVRGADVGEASASFRWGVAIALSLSLVAGPGVAWLLPWINKTLGAFLSTTAYVIAPTFIHPHTASPLIPIGVNLIVAPGASGTVFFPQAFNVGDPYVLFIMGIFLTALVAIVRSLIRRRHGIRQVNPWNGGFEPFTGHTSFSPEGFVHPLRLAFARFYGLKRNRTTTAGARFYRHTIINRLEEQIYAPILSVGVWLASQIRRIQSGRVTQYVAWVWVFMLIGIAIGVMR